MIILYPSLIPLLIIDYAVFKKFYRKKYILINLGFNNFKVNFILLTEVIIFYILVILVKIKLLKFKKSIRIIFKTYLI